jgi:hypothetical protein
MEDAGCLRVLQARVDFLGISRALHLATARVVHRRVEWIRGVGTHGVEEANPVQRSTEGGLERRSTTLVEGGGRGHVFVARYIAYQRRHRVLRHGRVGAAGVAHVDRGVEQGRVINVLLNGGYHGACVAVRWQAVALHPHSDIPRDVVHTATDAELAREGARGARLVAGVDAHPVVPGTTNVLALESSHRVRRFAVSTGVLKGGSHGPARRQCPGREVDRRQVSQINVVSEGGLLMVSKQ